MRAGRYAEFERVAYKARLQGDTVRLILPSNVPRPEGWVDRSNHGQWTFDVPVTLVSRVFRVCTYARLDGVPVLVRNVDDGRGTASLYARQSLPPWEAKRRENRVHPELHVIDERGGRAELVGEVLQTRLTDITESEVGDEQQCSPTTVEASGID